MSTKYVPTSPDVLLLQVCILCWKQANLNKTMDRKVVQRSEEEQGEQEDKKSLGGGGGGAGGEAGGVGG